MNEHDSNIFCEYTVKSWQDCRRLFGYLQHWVFRGQSNSEWSLQTTLERGATINNTDIRAIPKMESRIIEKFKRSAFKSLDMLNQECALLKVRIPKAFHNEIRKELKLMNITSETLFPGLDGFTQSLYGEFDSK